MRRVASRRQLSSPPEPGIARRSLGEGDPVYGRSLYRLAALYGKVGDYRRLYPSLARSWTSAV